MERPKATHIKNKPTILMKNITSHKLKSAGFPDFSPNMSTMSAKMTKNSHKSKVGAKKTRSATNRNRSKFLYKLGMVCIWWKFTDWKYIKIFFLVFKGRKKVGKYSWHKFSQLFLEVKNLNCFYSIFTYKYIKNALINTWYLW